MNDWAKTGEAENQQSGWRNDTWDPNACLSRAKPAMRFSRTWSCPTRKLNAPKPAAHIAQRPDKLFGKRIESPGCLSNKSRHLPTFNRPRSPQGIAQFPRRALLSIAKTRRQYENFFHRSFWKLCCAVGGEEKKPLAQGATEGELSLVDLRLRNNAARRFFPANLQDAGLCPCQR